MYCVLKIYTMKCRSCGFENNDKAKYCTKCGVPLDQPPEPPAQKESNNSKYIIIALVVMIIVLAGSLAFFAYNMNSNHVENDNVSQNNSAQQAQDSGSGSDDAKTQQVSSSQIESKSWQSIGRYSGSGSGSQTINVPSGQIMVKLSAYPIKNYATNHLYVKGSNGAGGGVDWGSHSDVETRSDSFEYTSSSDQTFTIDYYETVSWEVEFFRYQ